MQLVALGPAEQARQRVPGASAGAGPREQRQTVGRDPGQRRGQGAVQRDIVERVGQRAQVGQAVQDLGPGPVAAPIGDEGRDAALLEGAGEHRHVAGGPQQDGDLARRGRSLAQQLVDALGQQPRLGLAPARRIRQPARGIHERVIPSALVGDEQFDERLGRRGLVGEVLPRREPDSPGQQRREIRSEQRREDGVDGVEQLRVPAEVVGQLERRVALAQRRPAVAEETDVGMAEAVDRLELVADGEQVVALERVQDLHLPRVGVLELVDHHELEALGPGPPQPDVARQQRARLDLQVVEVQRPALTLGRGVGVVVVREQLPEQSEGTERVPVGARLRVGGMRLAVRAARGAAQ